MNLEISDLNGGQTHVVHLNQCKKASRTLVAPDDEISTVDTGEVTVGKGTSVGDATRTPVSEPLSVDPLSNDSDELLIGEELHSEEVKEPQASVDHPNDEARGVRGSSQSVKETG